MSDTTPTGPAHRAASGGEPASKLEALVRSLENTVNGVHAAVKAPHLTNAQLHQQERVLTETQKHTLEILLKVLDELSATKRTADEALTKAEQSLANYEGLDFPADPKVVALLRQGVTRARDQKRDADRKAEQYAESAEQIGDDAASTNHFISAQAGDDAEGLAGEVNEAMRGLNRKLGTLRTDMGKLDQRVTDEVEALRRQQLADAQQTKRMFDDRDKAVDERFRSDVKPLAKDVSDLKTANRQAKGVIARHEQRISKTEKGGESLGFLQWAIVAAAGGFAFVVWLIVTLLAGVNGGLAFVTALFIAVFVAAIALGTIIYFLRNSKQEEVEETETSSDKDLDALFGADEEDEESTTKTKTTKKVKTTTR